MKKINASWLIILLFIPKYSSGSETGKLLNIWDNCLDQMPALMGNINSKVELKGGFDEFVKGVCQCYVEQLILDPIPDRSTLSEEESDKLGDYVFLKALGVQFECSGKMLIKESSHYKLKSKE